MTNFVTRSGGKRVTPNSKGGTPWAKARSRCSPSVVPPPLYIAAAPFPKGGNTVEVLSQDAHKDGHLPSLTLELELVCTVGRDQRGVGLQPLPRIPTSSPSISLLPIPLHGLLLRSYGGGWGGKDDPIDWVVKGPAVSCPIPKK